MPSAWGPRLFWGCVFVLIIAAVFAWFYDPQAGPDLDRVGPVTLADRPVTISPRLHACELRLGDAGANPWKGEIKLGKGKLLNLTAGVPHPGNRLEGARFEVYSQQTQPATLRVTFLADPEDQLTLTMGDESKSVAVSDISATPRELFPGKASVSRAVAWQQVEHDDDSDDIFPRLFRDHKGQEYLVHLQCERGRSLDAQAVLNGNFDSLQQPVNGVSIRLTKSLQGVWQHSENVSGKLEAAVDPVLAVDPDGRMYVAWSQPSVEGWDIYYRVKDPIGSGEIGAAWSDPKKVTEQTGPHQQLQAATDASGKVWLVWQTWHFDHYEIFAAVINDDLHAWKKPGPAAEHARETEGRWNPTVAADSRGNLWIAWSVFRKGHFDIEMAKLNGQSPIGPAKLVAASARNETQPALYCDKQDQLWLAYAESEDVDERDFGHALFSADKIRVRVMSADEKLSDLPPVPRPKADREGLRGTCARPQLVPVGEGAPAVCFLHGAALVASWWQGSGWGAPVRLATPEGSITHHYAAMAAQGYLAAFLEARNGATQVRLHVAAIPVQANGSVEKTAVNTEALQAMAAPHWERYDEMARMFRQRPQDVNLSRKFLLRGLVFYPQAKEKFPDTLAAGRLVLEQAMADWILLPGDAEQAPQQRWWEGLRGDALTHKSERAWLNGYYRSTPEDGAPATLVLDHRLDYMALPEWKSLHARAAEGELKNSTSVAQEADLKLLEQFVSQQQDIGFLPTSQWQMLATFNPPSTSTRSIELSEAGLMPFWRPAQQGAKSAHSPCLRLVAYADGKSREQLREALRDRHYYLATDDIYLLVRCDKRVPGDVFQTARVPTISVQVLGTGKIAKVEVWRDQQLIKSEEPPGNAAVLECPNPDVDRQWHNYMVRVVQADGEMAISQPLWIRHQP